MSVLKKILKFFMERLKHPYKCDQCGPCGWSYAFIGFDIWNYKDGSTKFLCRACSGYRSMFP